MFDAHLFIYDKAIVGSTVRIGKQQKTFRKCGNEILENDFNCSYSLSRSNSQTYSMWVGVRFRINIAMVTAVYNVNIHGRVILKLDLKPKQWLQHCIGFNMSSSGEQIVYIKFHINISSLQEQVKFKFEAIRKCEDVWMKEQWQGSFIQTLKVSWLGRLPFIHLSKSVFRLRPWRAQQLQWLLPSSWQP